MKEEFADVLFVYTSRVASGCMGVVKEYFRCKLHPDGTYVVSDDWYEPIWVCHPSGNLCVEVSAARDQLPGYNTVAVDLETNGEHCAELQVSASSHPVYCVYRVAPAKFEDCDPGMTDGPHAHSVVTFLSLRACPLYTFHSSSSSDASDTTTGAKVTCPRTCGWSTNTCSRTMATRFGTCTANPPLP